MQLPMGRVFRDWGRVGDHCRCRILIVSNVCLEEGGAQGRRGRYWEGIGLTILTVPSHELETKVSFVVWFQNTEKVSLLCSW